MEGLGLIQGWLLVRKTLQRIVPPFYRYQQAKHSVSSNGGSLQWNFGQDVLMSWFVPSQVNIEVMSSI